MSTRLDYQELLASRQRLNAFMDNVHYVPDADAAIRAEVLLAIKEKESSDTKPEVKKPQKERE